MSSKEMRIVFFGTSKFAVPILKVLNKSSDFDIGLIITEPPKPAGRKKELALSPVHNFAQENDLDLFPPTTLRGPEVQKVIKEVKADVFIVVSYGKIIPVEVFNIPKFKTINVHPSLLPKYRGASPIQNTLLNDDKRTGVTLILIDEDVDHGPIISQEEFNTDSSDTFNTLEIKLAELGGNILLRDLSKYISGEIKPTEQNHSEATFTKKITKEDGLIDWNQSATQIYNQWRAFIRWPGVYTIFNDTRFNLKKIKIAQDIKGQQLGKIFSENKQLFISCAKGVIEIEEIQPEGKNVMDANSFINGYNNLLG